MNNNTLLRDVFIAICIIGFLILPAAAAPAVQRTTVKTVDQGLKDDLWASHQQYRLQRFDTNVQQAESVITILDKYSIDTTTCRATLATISGKRSALDTALTNRDREGLKTINAGLRTLWKQFLKDVRDAIRAHYKIPSGGSAALISADSLGTIIT